MQHVQKANKATQSQEIKTTLQRQEFALQEEFQRLSQQGSVGDYNLVLKGTKEFEEILKARTKNGTKRPQSNLQYVLWKGFKSQTGGKLDIKQSKLDQTNKARLMSVRN